MKPLLVFIFVILTVTCKSQHDHGGGGHDSDDDKPSLKEMPQHGGEVIEAGKYKLEVLLNPMQKEEKLCVYVLKKNHKKIETKNVVGNVEIKYKDGTTEKIELKILDDKLVGEPQQIGNPANYCFSIIIKNKEYRACYFYKGLIK